MDYDSSTLIQLKTMCKDRGLRISGSKAEVVIRLMEDDESKSPQPIEIKQQVPVQSSQPVTQIFITNNSAGTIQITGVGIMIYGLFRIGMAVIFSEWMHEESFIAMLIGLGFIAGGIITVQGYKEGLYITLIVLAFSGIMSLIYHDKFSPLSIGMGVWPIEISMMCSGTCMLIVALPLFTSHPSTFRDDSPSYFSAAIGALDLISPLPIMWGNPKTSDNTSTKIVINCIHCDSALKVPNEYKGNVRCPTCKEKFEVK